MGTKHSEHVLQKRREKFYSKKIGLKIGRLTILSYKGVDSSQKHLFEMECACGNIKILRWNNVQKNGNTSSCGCYKKECIRKRVAKSIEDLCIKRILNYCKNICEKRNFDFDLDFNFVKNNIFKKCHYCDLEPSNTFKSNNSYYREIKYNGLDRKNNKLGYTKENVVTCCMECNYMKREKDYNYFIDKCKKIINNICKEK